MWLVYIRNCCGLTKYPLYWTYRSISALFNNGVEATESIYAINFLYIIDSLFFIYNIIFTA